MFLWPTPSYAATGVLEDLTPYIQKSKYDINDYWPSLLESAKYNDNKAIFDEAGVAYPTNDWIWDDLRAASQKLTVVR